MATGANTSSWADPTAQVDPPGFAPSEDLPQSATGMRYPRGTLWGSSWRWDHFFPFFFSWAFWKSFIWDVQFSSLSLWGCDTHRQSWVQARWALCWEAKPPRAMPNPLAPQPPSGHLTFAFYIPHFLLDIPISISLSDYFNFEKLNHHLPNFNSHNLFLWGDAEKGKNNEYFEWCGSQLCAFPEICAACKRCRNNHWKWKKKKSDH